jgi:hypothetical protein
MHGLRFGRNPDYAPGVCFSPDDGGGSGGDSGGDSHGDPGAFLDDVILDLGENDPNRGAEDKNTIFGTGEDTGEKDEEGEKDGSDDDKKDDKKKSKKEGEESEESDGEEGEEGEDDGEEKDKKGESSVIKQLRHTIRSQEKRLKDLEKAKKSEAEGEKEEPAFTDDQLEALLEEHKDEPKVLLNIMKYIQQKGLKDAEKVQEVVAGQKEVATTVTTYLSNGLGDDYKPGEWLEVMDSKGYTAQKLGLEGNPLEKQIRSMLYLAAQFETTVKKRVAAVLEQHKTNGTNIEKKRVNGIKNAGVPKGGAGGSAGSGEKDTSRASMVAKEIGLGKVGQALYAGFRNSASKTSKN